VYVVVFEVVPERGGAGGGAVVFEVVCGRGGSGGAVDVAYGTAPNGFGAPPVCWLNLALSS
jgi:hypothetical protein